MPKLKIADVTYGRGVFWRQVDLSDYDFQASDLITVPDHRHDFRHLPYEDNEFDVVVLDPPYRHDPGTWLTKNYQNVETTMGLSHEGIINLYRDGMREALRVLRPGGTAWVKCQDEVQSGKQMWSHIEIYNSALQFGFLAQDLFVFVQRTAPKIQNPSQKHARRNHSYLWILQKPVPKKTRASRTTR
jgi:DNA modification methylase